MNTAVIMGPPAPPAVRLIVHKPSQSPKNTPTPKQPTRRRYARPLAFAALFTLLTASTVVIRNMISTPSPRLSGVVLSSMQASYHWNQYYRVASQPTDTQTT